MKSILKKRKLGDRQEVERRVRAKPTKFADEDKHDQSDEDEAGFRDEDSQDSASASGSEGDEDDEDAVSGEEDDDAETDESPEPAPPSPVENLTFGQILKKQEKASSSKAAAKGKTASKATADQDAEDPTFQKEHTTRASTRKSKPSRAHKHAPTEVTSRFAVKRGRDWNSGDATIAGITVKSSEARSRDPRFFLASMASQPPSREDELRAQRNYAFLDEYRDNEMSQLREEMVRVERIAKAERKKSRRNAGNLVKAEAAEKEAADLKQQLMSMEAKKRDHEAKAKAQAVLDEHRKRERDLVRQGKTPYFLKKSEQKERLLVDKFAGMTDQQVEKAIEKRRKKAASRERREMPTFRRGA